mgnify:CR=1 FL=1
MSDLFSQTDPMVIGAILGPLVHQLAKYTNDIHGKTRPFVIYVCIMLGIAGGLIYWKVGNESWEQGLAAFFKIAGMSLGFANSIWMYGQKVIKKYSADIETVSIKDQGNVTGRIKIKTKKN